MVCTLLNVGSEETAESSSLMDASVLNVLRKKDTSILVIWTAGKEFLWSHGKTDGHDLFCPHISVCLCHGEITVAINCDLFLSFFF